MKRKYILFFVLLLPLAMNGAGIGINGICYNLNTQERTAESIDSYLASGYKNGVKEIKGISTLTSCPDDHHPHVIDLGLPSGTKWACCNVGADTPEGYGGYYTWGETEEKSTYNWASYAHCDGSANTCHDLGENIAGTKYDVAHMICGENWLIPTVEQFQELIENCTYTWTTRGDITGAMFTGNNGASIFIPASGFCQSSGFSNVGNCGYYWSDTNNSATYNAYYFLTLSSKATSNNAGYRYQGRSVRPVFTNIPIASLHLSETNVNIQKENEANIEITSGNGNYTIANSNTSVAVAVIDGGSVRITAIAVGTSTVTVTDTRTKESVSIDVTVSVSSTSLCPDDHHPHMINLDLPSGTLWSCCYVGASSPTGTGGYYAWGETEEKDYYSWGTYIHCNGSQETCRDLGESIIGTQYDVARVQWGDTWQMATVAQNKELVDNCTYSWTTIDGISGGLFTGSNGAAIFFPASGYRTKNGYNNLGINAWCWTGEAYSENNYDSRTFVLSSTRASTTNRGERYYGRTVHPVSTISAFVPLQLSESSVEMIKGDDATIEITSGNGIYTITSSNSNIATATITDSSVNIHAVNGGTAIITVTDKKNGDQVTIEVLVLVHLQLAKSSVEMSYGNETTIDITMGNGNYTVTSSNTNVATAAIEGNTVKIVTVGAGTATITLTDSGIGETAEISVTVYPVFSVSESTLNLMFGAEGTIVRLTGGSGSYNFSSSNVNVVTPTFEQLEDGGNISVHATGAGTATITITDTQTGEQLFIDAMVLLPLELTKTALRLYLNYNREWVRISSGNGSYTVTSNNENVATAMIDGSSVKVTAIARGTATITVTDTQTGLTVNIAVTVVDHSNDPLTPSSPLPSNGAVDVGTSGTFAWLIPAFNGGKGTHFELYLDTDSRFRNTNEQPYQTDEGNSCGFTGLKAGTKYYWKVKVYNEKGQYTISDTWSFTTREKKPITNALLGDVNDDNLISVTDVMMMVNFVLGQPTNGFNASKADINDDNSIGVSDIMMVVDIILNSTESGDPYLVIWHKDGSKVQFKLTEKPKITYLGETVSIKASSTVEYEFQAIRKMTFERHARKLLTPMKPFTIEGEAITFLPANKDLHVKAALTNGEIVKGFVVRKGETATLPLESRPANDYVINVNGVTYKIKTK